MQIINILSLHFFIYLPWPIFAFLGSEDDIIIRSAEKDLEIIKEKAVSCQDFTTCIFDGASHTYDRHEIEIGSRILEWIKSKF